MFWRFLIWIESLPEVYRLTLVRYSYIVFYRGEFSALWASFRLTPPPAADLRTFTDRLLLVSCSAAPVLLRAVFGYGLRVREDILMVLFRSYIIYSKVFSLPPKSA